MMNSPNSRASTPLDNWAAGTHSHLSSVGALRENVRNQLYGRDAGDGERTPQIGGSTMEDKLKMRHRTTQHLSASVTKFMEKIQYIIFQVRQCLSNLSRRISALRADLSVVEMRMDLRSQRPRSELIEDAFQEALQQEQATTLDALHLLTSKLETGGQLIKDLEDAKSEMHSRRLNLHLDRSGHMQRVLDRVVELEKFSEQACKEINAVLEETERRTKKSSAKTCSAMKQKIAATIELKEQIENDMRETRHTIAEVELRIDRWQRELEIQKNMPERQVANAHGVEIKKLPAATGILPELRSKIKAAAYTGTNGRRLDVLFGRFDRDGTGMLDGEEVRRAFRRACKVAPSVVSDAEIASLCQLLDADSSGCVSINELIDFLCADCTVEDLEDQCNWAKSALENLKVAQEKSHIELKNKVACWKIDLACSRANPIKSLKLDSISSPGRPTTASVASSFRAHTLPPTPGRPTTSSKTPAQATKSSTSSSGWGASSAQASLPSPRSGFGSRPSPRTQKPQPLPSLAPKEDQKPSIIIDAATAETLKSKFKAAAYIGNSGQQIDAIFKRFDKDGSGHLRTEEVRMAMRRTLRIPPSVISDADISALCVLLDADNSGIVNVNELVAFLGPEPTNSKRMGKPSAGNALEPRSNGSHGGPPDESAGPPSS